MLEYVQRQDFALVALLALFSHAIFKRYEPTHPYALALLLAVVPAIPGAWQISQHRASISSVFLAFPTYYAALLTSVAAYRLSPLHPLYRYPGPLISKLSNIRLAYITSKGKEHKFFQELHTKYGPVVRLGPNEISIIDKKLLPLILGPDGMPKGHIWTGRQITRRSGGTKGGLIGHRDLKVHAEDRKQWNRAFTSSAMKGYEPITLRRVEVDLSSWFSYCLFDWMGDMAFGGGFELMHEGDVAGLYRTMSNGLYFPAITGHIPWAATLSQYLPFVAKQTQALGAFAYRQVKQRLESGSVTNDLFYHLLDAVPEGEKAQSLPLMITASLTAIVAGSETSATTLAQIYYCLLSNPAYYARLKKEVDETFGTEPPTNAAKLAQMEYLNAIINEALRLFPPLPICLQRGPTPGSGGHLIAPDFFVPEGTGVFVPPYVMQRDPQYFAPDPEAFRPERWLPGAQPASTVHDLEAYIPFSAGPMNCVGKPAALLVVRMILAHMIQAFDAHFAEGYDKARWEEDLCDYFTWRRGKLPVVLVPR